MNIGVIAAKVGDKVIVVFAVILMVLLMSYGSFSLWYTYMTMQEGFLNNELMALKPFADKDGSLSFQDLLMINEDVRAWITIDDTHIDYPMVQGEDDMEYINRDATKEFSLSGAIFLSAGNKADFSDPYMMTYGHHMDNGGMYGDVMEFIKKDYFDEHKTGHLFLPDGTARKLEVFALIECDAYDRMIYSTSGREGHIMELVEYLKKNSTNYRDIGLKEGDQIMALSTCVSLETNGRVVVLARVNL